MSSDPKDPTQKRPSAYEHHDSVTGATPREDAFTEHRDTAVGSPETTNEIDMERRQNPDKQHGPETHQATRVTRKDGA